MGRGEPASPSSPTIGGHNDEYDRSDRRHVDSRAQREHCVSNERHDAFFEELVEIARIMKEEGYIADYTVIPGEPQATLEITLKYGPKKQRTITGIRRISKPGLRVYAKKDELPRVLGVSASP